MTVYPLNMAPDSVDDDYKGCSAKMSKLVDTEYLPLEKCGTFKEAWEKAEKEIQKKKPQLDKLSMNHAIAILVYSYGTPDIYHDLNNAVHTSKKYYTTTFQYHSLHFLLIDAIQRLNPKGKCFQVYRGTDVEFKHQNPSMRFGTFTSTSVYPNNATKFGSKSCFEVWTCHGAKVSKYSQYPDENEVLIPPYEKFTIKKIIKNPKNQTAIKCETVYQLKSSGIKSSLRCALFKKASRAL
ncbi:NAD(P)(+)--arginine ADP-ribosyltransferase 2-like [Clupea harengus]|uniref:NAD(P)(+)--arginine ADP-ribosyltransferase n=1 Tax=Clupea harengus TaxID=7950 RepID=A0A6P8EU58_CLUHA|nr:NAD(P)(+)--arginine ADP-ribosyltransferase 2-like [Clupea harengus]